MVDNFASYQKTLNKTFYNAMNARKIKLNEDDEYEAKFKILWKKSQIA